MTQKEINSAGDLPLTEGHICFTAGHAMHQVYVFHGPQSSWGQNKCFRCGYEEDFQYDYIGSNPMYYQIP